MPNLFNIYEQKLEAGSLKPDPDQQRAILALDDLCAALRNYDPKPKLFRRRPRAPKGFYFYGGVGRGKSMLMDLFFAAAPVARKRRVHFHAFMLEVHDFLHQLRQRREAAGKIDDDLLACADWVADQATLLCFDEFQVKDVADAMILGRLFTALFERGVVVVTTSNIAPDDLYADGLQRDRFLPFIALLKKKTNVFLFTGDTDYRLQRLVGKKVYFWPHDNDAAAELDRLFMMVADGAKGEPCDITVKGRVIRVPRAEKETAFFTFHELCGENRSAVDYLELTKRFRVFILANVPKITDADRNAALRFVTLIDTLYDHRAHLVMSAATPPDRIYTGEELAAVFPRTVSRLEEMQSLGYGVEP